MLETTSVSAEPFWLQLGDRVEHVGDTGFPGTVTHIDDNLLMLGYGVTTCCVLWDDGDGEYEDIQWTNKLVLVDRASTGCDT